MCSKSTAGFGSIFVTNCYNIAMLILLDCLTSHHDPTLSILLNYTHAQILNFKRCSTNLSKLSWLQYSFNFILQDKENLEKKMK